MGSIASFLPGLFRFNEKAEICQELLGSFAPDRLVLRSNPNFYSFELSKVYSYEVFVTCLVSFGPFHIDFWGFDVLSLRLFCLLEHFNDFVICFEAFLMLSNR
jgi:hypothetical protein